MTWKLRPEILLCPNIPKPLHGVAPRNILGGPWWNKTRREAYASTNQRCVACGVHRSKARLRQWLEGHELYRTDYVAGRLTYLETVPLCHCCHNFIHDGRLNWLLSTGRIHHRKYATIIQHGEEVLLEAGLRRLSYEERERELIRYLKLGQLARWEDWKLVLFGREYPTPYASQQEWEAHHRGKDEEG